MYDAGIGRHAVAVRLFQGKFQAKAWCLGKGRDGKNLQ